MPVRCALYPFYDVHISSQRVCGFVWDLQGNGRKKDGKLLSGYGTDHHLSILVPGAFLVGLLLVSQGVPQTLMGNVTVETIEGTYQDIASMGPVAALEIH